MNLVNNKILLLCLLWVACSYQPENTASNSFEYIKEVCNEEICYNSQSGKQARVFLFKTEMRNFSDIDLSRLRLYSNRMVSQIEIDSNDTWEKLTFKFLDEANLEANVEFSKQLAFQIHNKYKENSVYSNYLNYALDSISINEFVLIDFMLGTLYQRSENEIFNRTFTDIIDRKGYDCLHGIENKEINDVLNLLKGAFEVQDDEKWKIDIRKLEYFEKCPLQ